MPSSPPITTMRVRGHDSNPRTLPAAQFVQVVASSVAENVPAAHGVQTASLVEVHAEVVMPSSAGQVAVHTWHATSLFTAENFDPAVQVSQTVSTFAVQSAPTPLPAGQVEQAWQAAGLVSTENVPVAHVEQVPVSAFAVHTWDAPVTRWHYSNNEYVPSRS